MHNYLSQEKNPPQDDNNPLALESVNKYVYVKHNFVPTLQEQGYTGSKVLVNPLFNKKIFVNPNYHVPSTSLPTKIHINPRIKTADLAENITKNNIHINPKVLRNIPIMESNFSKNSLLNHRIEQSPKTVVTIPQRVRRTSVCSKFKIVRSTYNSSPSLKKRYEKCNKTLVNTRYKFSRGMPSNRSPPKSTKIANKYKLDNRKNKNIITSPKNKFIYVNRFLSIRDIAKKVLLKPNKKSKSNLVNIRGTMYNKSPNSLRRTSTSRKSIPNILKVQNMISKSKYKYVRRTLLATTDNKLRYTKRVSKVKSRVSTEKLKKCNIPCPYYRKLGRCKGKEIGKCNRKHDPDQVALCTKFLQGACIDNKCLLSHNVSPEKMPTCKFYLEGTCSRDDCPYLHVRISPKADICRDFLEGFCKKASECDKRHQFLCPDYEKRGCGKVRCPYPHGKMVRKYSLLNRNKFVKKSSDNVKSKPSQKCENYIEKKEPHHILSTDELATNPVGINKRYYAEEKVVENQNIDLESCVDTNECDQDVGFRSRPKLGELPSYIAFKEL
ncbi:unnamed protein product [Phaedon cochleariae]|uniref:Zinc finger CCCH domain-containing protein 3 n=1 Tax=Phaedon cochleariae TaxID=80249 RepID=A0A9P0GQJ7_PHACE|nr:unnamed protein product [Phaedon cochleariae]